MNIIRATLFVSAIMATGAQAENTQGLPALPTTQPAQTVIYNAPAAQPVQQQAFAPQPVYVSAPAQSAVPVYSIAQQAQAYVAVPMQQPASEAAPAGPSYTVSKNGQTAQAPQVAAYQQQPVAVVPQAQPVQQYTPLLAPQYMQPQPVYQQYQPSSGQAAQAPIITPQLIAIPQAQPQAQLVQPQMQQLQPAAGQPAQTQIITPRPIAIPQAQPEAAPAPSATVANEPSTNSMHSLYTLGSISAGVPAGKSALPKDSYKTLDEDAWKQIEFVPSANRDYISSKVAEVIKFKQQNWAGSGFRNVYVRPEAPVALPQLGLTKTRLPKTKPTSLAVKSGFVTDGFTIADSKSGWFMYGQKNADGKITSLAISPDDTPMSQAFAKSIAATAGSDLTLVDWYKDRVVDTSSANAILDWASAYKPADLVK